MDLKPGQIVKVRTFGAFREAEVIEAREVDVVIRWMSNRKRALVDRASVQVERTRQATKTIERSIHDEETKDVSESAMAVRDAMGLVHRAFRGTPKTKMVRSVRYMDFVRAKSCCSCSAPSPSDPHHYGSGGMGLKTDDLRVVPLCRRCHDHFHDHRRLPNMDVATTRSYLLAKQVDLLVEYIARGNVGAETRSEEA